MGTKDVAVRSLVGEDTASIMRAILSATDYGVMLTDLDHETLACNRRFGEIFEIDIDDVVNSQAPEVREKVRRLIPDMAAWESNLAQVYADPSHVQEDSLKLMSEPVRFVRRYTGPVIDGDGRVIGRLWTFLDITHETRLKSMREAAHQLSAFHDPNPALIYHEVVRRLAEFYETNAILSILVGDRLEFKSISSADPNVMAQTGNTLDNSYCQHVLGSNCPLIFQDGLADQRTCGIDAALYGFRRYAGAPIYEPSGGRIGTLCMLDHKYEQPLDEEDLGFITLLASRIGAELARENQIRIRLEAQQATLAKQAEDLQATKQVLSVMNNLFAALGAQPTLDEVLARTASSMSNLLGFSGAAAIVHDGDCLKGATARGRSIVPVRFRPQDDPWLFESLAPENWDADGMQFTSQAQGMLAKSLGAAAHLKVRVNTAVSQPVYLCFGAAGSVPEASDQHVAYLEALAETVSLAINSVLLQSELNSAQIELQDTRDRLLQSEKLSVVGTLAASTAHDIRNIVASMAMDLETAGDDPAASIERFRANCDRFKILALRLLSYARPRMIVRKPVDLNGVLEQVLALTDAQVRMSMVQCHFEPAAGLPMFDGDEHQVEHLFVNLLMNALQAMTNGGEIAIKTWTAEETVFATVSDSGPGMDDDIIASLFQPFRSTRAEGFGLGLFSCKRIVEEHGGSISVEAKKGDGTTFIVRFPITQKVNP